MLIHPPQALANGKIRNEQHPQLMPAKLELRIRAAREKTRLRVGDGEDEAE